MAFKEAFVREAAKYGLPSYDALNKELNLSSCESEKFPLRQLRQAMKERIDLWLDMVESVVSPDQNSPSAMYELRCISEQDRKEAFELYRQLMLHYRSIGEAAIAADDAIDAKAINAAWKDWQGIKEQVLARVKKMKDCWQKEVVVKKERGYLG